MKIVAKTAGAAKPTSEAVFKDETAITSKAEQQQAVRSMTNPSLARRVSNAVGSEAFDNGVAKVAKYGVAATAGATAALGTFDLVKKKQER